MTRRAAANAGRFPTARFLAALVPWLLAAAIPAAPLREPGLRPLFNGTNMAGWTPWLVDTHREDPRGVFRVTDGVLRFSGDGLGYLATVEEFADYQLRVEYRWGATNSAWGDRRGRARDSGVFMHVTGPDGNSEDGRGAFRAGIECQVMEGATGDFLLIRGTNAQGRLIAPRLTTRSRPERDADGWPFFQPGGPQAISLERWGRINGSVKSRAWRDEFGFRGTEDAERPVGEWNRLVLTCEADQITVEVNGIRVNEATRVWPARGRILLQCEGSAIEFRRVDLLRIAR